MKQQVTFQLLSIDWIAGDRLKWSGGQKSRRIVAVFKVKWKLLEIITIFIINNNHFIHYMNIAEEVWTEKLKHLSS